MAATTCDTVTTMESDRLDRIRKLLAKAEATPYPEEAETFMEKVSELVARWGIDEARLWADAAPADRAAPVRSTIHVPAPYTVHKMVLVNEVAESCGCRCVRLPGADRDKVAVIGFEGDVRRTELLVTSLLLQLTRDLLAGTPRTGSASATASWRRSFIIGFASRIGERLTAARAEAAAEADAEGAVGSQSCELVLVDRDAQVGEKVRAEFPRLRTTRVSSGSSSSGRAAGRSSADRADLGTERLAGGRAELGS